MTSPHAPVRSLRPQFGLWKSYARMLLLIYCGSFLTVALALTLSTPGLAHAFTTITVTGTADGTLAALAGNGTCDLREAIEAANTNTTVGECSAGQAGPIVDVISFSIGTGVQAISMASALQPIIDPVTIDGTTQPGWSTAQTPQIVLDGVGAGGGAEGLQLAPGSDGSTVRGLVIQNFNASGIHVRSSNNIIESNYIGIGADGTTARPNATAGVFIDIGAQNNRVGTNGDGINDAIERNILSGNGSFGVAILGAGANNNVVAGNFIGTTANGDSKVANGSDGIRIAQSAASNRIGTDGSNDAFNANERNVISGNSGANILISDTGTDNNVVAGNFIGTNTAGTGAIAGLSVGIVVQQSAKNTRVGTNADGIADAEERNVFSGNAGYGVFVQGTGTTGTKVAGNYIGLNANGDGIIANNSDGLVIATGATNTLVGTTGDGSTNDANRRNIISGNNGDGIRIVNSGTSTNTVAGNYIGTDKTGLVKLNNTASGIEITGQATSNIIGTAGTSTSPAAERNVISGNTSTGVFIQSAGTDSNVVAGNYIGIKSDGSGALGNGTNGVYILNGPTSNRIGTDGNGTGDAAERNIISGNAAYGININGASTNIVAGNYIGTNPAGSAAIANGIAGLNIINGSKTNQIGTKGTSTSPAAERNVISGNADSGIIIDGNGTDSNIVGGNFIGINNNGDLILGNNAEGIVIQAGAKTNLIGTNGDGVNDATERNVISGNTDRGVVIVGSNTNNNTVAGNYIGTNANGDAPIGNGHGGVTISGGAQSNIIGTNGSNDAFNINERNIISGNGGAYGGVVISGSLGNTRNNVIAGNYIGTDVNGSNAIANYSGVGLGTQATNNRIGTDGNGIADAVEGNLISGNINNGILLQDNSTGNLIAGNFIGTNSLGTGAIANKKNGILLELGAFNNTFGGVAASTPNIIAFNLGNGIRITDNGTGNVLIHNSIFSNVGLAIDLGGDGVTSNDNGDVDTGPNGFQNYPVLSAANLIGGNTNVQGTLKSAANSLYTIQFYASPTCSNFGFGEGHTFLGELGGIQTNNLGVATFTASNLSPAPVGNQITALVTDVNNNTSEFAACLTVATAPITLGNQFWTNAFTMTLGVTSLPTVTQATVQQHLTAVNQSAWFAVKIKPGTRIQLNLTGMKVNYDLTLYSDIGKAYTQDLTKPGGLVKQTAEIAPDYLSPDYLSPDYLSPDYLSPDYLSPDYLSPDYLSPDYLSPDYLSPDYLSGVGATPANALQSFSNAQRRSLISFSARDGNSDEVIVQNTWDNDSYFYVRVKGRGGAFDTAVPFNLQVTVTDSACTNFNPTVLTHTVTADARNYKTIILYDLNRMSGAGDKAVLFQRLQSFANRAEIGAKLIDLSQDPVVQNALNQANTTANLSCPYAKNVAASLIKDIISAYQLANLNTMQYVVLVGNDEVIPFFRHPEQVELGIESLYNPPVGDLTASKASLREGYVLSQDRYGARVEITGLNRSLPVPNLAVGRLVETPQEVIGMLDTYLATSNGVISAPTSSLVTGYDFQTAGAQLVQSELQKGLNRTPDSLISAVGVTTDCTANVPLNQTLINCAWTADNLRSALLGSRHDLIYLAGHFSQGGALAADNKTRLSAKELLNSGVNLDNVILFSAGCHVGYNTVDADVLDQNGQVVTETPDWAQAAASKHMILIGGTGYQYGSDEAPAYSALLFSEFAKQLRTGTGPVSVGQALVKAKLAYLANIAQTRGIHDKTVLEITLYGLPMLSIDEPGQRLPVPQDPTIVSGPLNLLGGAGLGFAEISVAPTTTLHTVNLLNLTDLNNSVTASYLEGKDGVVVNPSEPFLPLATYNVSFGTGSTAPTVLRGVGFRGGDYQDSPDSQSVVALTGAPATEIRGTHSYFTSEVFFPNKPWNVNYFGAIADPINGATRLMVTPAQHVSVSPGSQNLNLRKFTNLNFRLYYNSSTTDTIALAGAPAVANIVAAASGHNVNFTISIQGQSEQVWVTYTSVNPTDPEYGHWLSLDLNALSGTSNWEKVLTVTGNPSDLRFMVQAVNSSGLVTLDSRSGTYYTPVVITTHDKISTALGLQTSLVPASGVYSSNYGTSAVFSATLRSSAGDLLAGQTILFSLGLQLVNVKTDNSGVAQVNLQLLQTPGSYNLSVSFVETADYQSSALSVPFTINKLPTQLGLNSPVANEYNDGTPLVARLKDINGQAVQERTIFFQVSGPGGFYLKPVITDILGRAPLGPVLLSPGTYNITAYFGNPGNALPVVGNVVDPIYSPSLTNTTYSIPRANQGISFSLGNLIKHAGDAPFSIVATSTSGLPVSFAARPGPTVCTVSSAGLITILRAGDCTIVASQSGDSNYNPAPNVENTLTILAVTMPPITSATLSIPPNSNGWNRNDVTVTLTASDNSGTGIAGITYWAVAGSGGGQTIMTRTVTVGTNNTAQVVINTEGSTTLSFYAIDNQGTKEALVKTQVIQLDKTAPELDLYFDKTAKALKLATTDELSGAATLPVSLTQTALKSPASYILKDKAGNSLTVYLRQATFSARRAGYAGVMLQKLVYDSANYSGTLNLENPLKLNGFIVQWDISVGQAVTDIDQTFILDKSFTVGANFSFTKNSTSIIIQLPAKPEVKRTENGLTLLHSISNKGKLDYKLITNS